MPTIPGPEGSRPPLRDFFAALALLVILCRPGLSQCPDRWLTVTGYPGTDGPVSLLAVHPDGRVFAGGSFSSIGDLNGVHAARFDPAAGRWSPIAPGLTANISAILVTPEGDVLASGNFTSIGGVPAMRIARFSHATQTWQPLGEGLGGGASALAVLPNGDIVAGGLIAATGSGTTALGNIGRFSSATGAWTPLGSGVNNRISTLAALPDGDIVAGGVFTQAGGTFTPYYAARFDFETGLWTPLGGQVSGGVTKLILSPDGSLLGLGGFQLNGGAAHPIGRYRFETGAWEPLLSSGSQFRDGVVNDVIELPGGDLLAGGEFQLIGGVAARRLARYHPPTDTWSPVGSGIQVGSTLAAYTLALLPTGEVVVGGAFTGAGDKTIHNIARVNLDTGAWSSFTEGSDGSVAALRVLRDGSVAVGGTFTVAGGLQTANIARYNPVDQSWSPLGAGLSPPQPLAGVVRAIIELPGGDLVASGVFSSSGDLTLNRIARYSFATGAWSDLGALPPPGINGSISALALLPDGDLLVGGLFSDIGGIHTSGVARLNLTTNTWSALTSSPGGWVQSLLVLPSGDLIVGGRFTAIGGLPFTRIARYNFNTGAWSALGSGMTGSSSAASVLALHLLPGGDLLAAGDFTTAGGLSARRIARYNFATGLWSALGTGLNDVVSSIVALPGDRIAVGGGFTTAGGLPALGAAQYSFVTSAWSPMGAGSLALGAMVELPGGDLFAAGTSVVDGRISTPLVRYDFAPGAPNITLQPVSARLCSAAPATIQIAVDGPGTTFRWQFEFAPGDWRDLVDGVNPLPCGDATATGTSTPRLGLSVPACPGGLRVRCAAANSCGESVSQPATLSRCPADFNCDGSVDPDDLSDAITCYFAVPACAGADFNGDGETNADDLSDMITTYFAGC